MGTGLPQKPVTDLLAQSALIARVVGVQDPQNENRVLLQIGGQQESVWARVLASYAGQRSGAFFVPSVGDEVLVAFVSGDLRQPVVLGGLWNGKDSPPDSRGADVEPVKHPIPVASPASRPLLVENSAGTRASGDNSPQLINPSAIRIEGGVIKIDAPGAAVEITAAASVTITAPELRVNASMATFNGIVQCQTLEATSVVAANYTPGTGNLS